MKSSRSVRALYAASLVSCLSLGSWHAARWISALSLGELPMVVLASFLGVALADAVAGGVHWACDTWGDENTPWLGPHLIGWFREHHRDPVGIVRRDSLEIDGPAATAAAIALVLLALPTLQTQLAPRTPLYAGLWSLCCVGALANHLHAWAHAPRPPALVGWLQRRGWILARRQHAKHHRQPHNSHYCIATGWLNRPLDLLGFWHGLEFAVSFITGAQPRGQDSAPAVRRSLQIGEVS